jgi:hypothetical protein
VPQFCGGTAASRMNIEEVNKLMVLKRYVKDIIESSLLEHYYGDRAAFRSCAVFIAGQIFEALLGELFAPAYLPSYPRAPLRTFPSYIPSIDLGPEMIALTQLYEMTSRYGSKLVENAIQSAKNDLFICSVVKYVKGLELISEVTAS